MSANPRFVYVIYIASTPDKVWHALTDAETSGRYWFGYRVVSDWNRGSSMALEDSGGKIMDKGVVLESNPPRRLSYSWFPQYEAFKSERPSRVTFTLEPFKDQVQLTIIHDEFDEGSKVFASISSGWPKVLSSLKSLLETGKALEPSWSVDDEKKTAEAEGSR